MGGSCQGGLVLDGDSSDSDSGSDTELVGSNTSINNGVCADIQTPECVDPHGPGPVGGSGGST